MKSVKIKMLADFHFFDDDDDDDDDTQVATVILPDKGPATKSHHVLPMSRRTLCLGLRAGRMRAGQDSCFTFQWVHLLGLNLGWIHGIW